MDDLLKVIKTIALETIQTTKPVTWVYGNVVETSPLKVSLETKLQLDSDFIEFGSIKTSNIENGDKLILLRQQGGQRFLCLDVSNVQIMTDLDIVSQPNKTYYIDKEKKIVQGTVEDYLKTVEQSVYLILQTERYDYIMYSHKYGIELKDLYGREENYVVPMLMLRVPEALLQDERIESVEDFSYTVNGGKFLINFTIKTKYGDLKMEGVEINV